jgi:single-strand DNA-binding protein
MVKGFSHVTLIGNLTRDPETRNTSTGTSVTNFSLAVNNKWRGKDGAEHEDTGFFDCVAWAKGGEIIAQYLRKGNPLFVTGRLSQRSWEDAATKKKRYATEVIVDDFTFLGGDRTGGQSGGSYNNGNASSKAASSAPSAPTPAKEVDLSAIDEDTEIDLSEVPF